MNYLFEFLPERAMKTAELKNLKKEHQIDQMTAEAILNELKDKRLPTYGTAQERKDRLKKQFGIQPKAKSGITQSAVANLAMPDAALIPA